MPQERRRLLRKTSFVLGLLSALSVLACISLLTAGLVDARAHERASEAELLILKEQVQTDAEVAEELHAVQLAEADRRLALEQDRNWSIGVLLTSAALLILCVKWFQTLETWRAPGFDDLRELRAAREGGGTPPSLEALNAPSAPDFDVSLVDQIIARAGTSREAAIPILNAIQARFGYLPDDALRHVCERTEITPAQIAGNSTFYSNFRRSPVGRHVVRVCHGTACHVSGAKYVEEELRRDMGIPHGEDTDPERQFTVDEVACLGCCSLAPVIMVDEWTAGRLTPETAVRALAPWKATQNGSATNGGAS